jgi:hypothetical protein
MACTCGSPGALDGHSPFCALRRVEDTRLNRVTVGLPERVESAKASLRDHEKMIEEIRKVVAAWRTEHPGWTHNAMKEIERIVK